MNEKEKRIFLYSKKRRSGKREFKKRSYLWKNKYLTRSIEYTVCRGKTIPYHPELLSYLQLKTIRLFDSSKFYNKVVKGKYTPRQTVKRMLKSDYENVDKIPTGRKDLPNEKEYIY